jgi:hypothetical protein
MGGKRKRSLEVREDQGKCNKQWKCEGIVESGGRFLIEKSLTAPLTNNYLFI